MTKEIWEKLGVKPMINAAATQTPIGGSRMNPKVAEAMMDASQYFVDVNELHEAVGREVARMTRNEDAMITAGVASAFYLVTMALLSVKAPAAFEKIPWKRPEKQSVLIYETQCVEYVIGVELAGVRLRRIQENGAVDCEAVLLEHELEAEKPLAVFYVMAGQWIQPGAPSLTRTIEVCARYDVPVIVDAAAQLPPKSNLWTFTQMGAELVLFSGGKDLRGPSHVGLALGRHWLVNACRNLISPHEGVGRFFKVGKEELIGALVAVRCYMEQDEEARLQWCENTVREIADGLAEVKGIQASRAYPNEAGQPVPRVFVRVESACAADIQRICHDFRVAGTPIAFLLDDKAGGFYINPMTLGNGESQIILREMKHYFSRMRKES